MIMPKNPTTTMISRLLTMVLLLLCCCQVVQSYSLQVEVTQFSDTRALETCRADLWEIDADNEEGEPMKLTRDEYAAFLQLETANELSDDFDDLPFRMETIYFSTACMCDVVDPTDLQCCTNGKDHIPLNTSLSALVDPYLDFFCVQVITGLQDEGFITTSSVPIINAATNMPTPALTSSPTDGEESGGTFPGNLGGSVTVVIGTVAPVTSAPTDSSTTSTFPGNLGGSATIIVPEPTAMVTEMPTSAPTDGGTTSTFPGNLGGSVSIVDTTTTDSPTSMPTSMITIDMPTFYLGETTESPTEAPITATDMPTEAPAAATGMPTEGPVQEETTVEETSSPTAGASTSTFPGGLGGSVTVGISTMAPTEPLLCVDFQYVVRNQVGLDAEAIFTEENNMVLQGLKKATQNITIEILNGTYPPQPSTRRLQPKRRLRRSAATNDRNNGNPSRVEDASFKDHPLRFTRQLVYYSTDNPVIINSISDNPLCNGASQNEQIKCAIVSSTVCVVLEEGDDPEEARQLLIQGLRVAVDTGDFLGRIPPEDLIMS